MSFYNPSATPVVRTRRTKDGANRNVVIGIARRREPSKIHEDKSSTSNHTAADDTCDTIERDGEGEVSTASSPGGTGTKDGHSHVSNVQLFQAPLLEDPPSSQAVTPIALQKYLDQGPEDKAPEPAHENEPLHPHIHREDTEQSQGSEEKKRSRKRSPYSKYESTIVQMLEGPDQLRLPGPANLPPQHGHTTEAPIPGPALAYQMVPSFTPPLYDSPLLHHLPPPNHAIFQDYGGYDGSMERDDAPRFAPGHTHPVGDSASPMYHSMPAQIEPIQNQLQAFAPQSLVQHAHFGDAHGRDELFSTLHQINSVLPRISAFLEQGSVFPIGPKAERPEKPTTESVPREVLQEKENQIIHLRKTIKGLRIQLEEEKAILRDRLDNAQSAYSELEVSLNKSQNTQENLRTEIVKIQREKTEFFARTRQSEAALEAFIKWLLQQTETRHPEEDQNTRPMYITERASGDHLEVAVHSIKASRRMCDDGSGDGVLPGGEDSGDPDESNDITVTYKQVSPSGAHLEEGSPQEELLNYSPWLSHGWRTAATDARVRLWEEDHARLKRETEEQHQQLTNRYEREKQDLELIISTSQARYEKRYQRLEAENMALRQEKELLKTRLASQHARCVQSNLELKACAARVDQESHTLQKVLEANLTASDNVSLR